MQNHQIFAGQLTNDPRSMSIEHLHNMRLSLVGEVTALLNRDASEGLRWHGTRRDLLEALHTAYFYGRIVDADGQLLSFLEIVKRSYDILHLPCPHNPWSIVVRAKNRKGMRQTTFFERYCHLRQSAPSKGIIEHLIN